MLMAAAMSAVAALGAIAADAQTFPDKPIRMVVGFAPGGGADIAARLVGQKLGEALGQPVVIDNRPGAGGTIGTTAVAKAAPDGYTLLMQASGPHAIAPALYASLQYDVMRDFAPISLVNVNQYVLAVHPLVAAVSVSELLAWLKSRPAPETYASAGNGTPAHLAAELFAAMAGVKLLHVPYRGAAPALTGLMGGEVKLLFSEMSVALPHLKEGKIRPLAITSLARSPLAPDLPTLNESGLPGYEALVWQGLLAPAGTSAEIVARLNAETVRILNQSEVKKKFASLAATVAPGTPAEFAAVIKRDLDKWTKVIKDANIKAE
jgi:tripartite-type tricarboxylate transporter receptor subunit TctC